MSYEPPINVIYRDIAEQVTQQSENAIMQAVNMYVQVDKAELIRALEYDRGQYKKGYADAKRDYERPQGKWIDTGNMEEYWAEEYQCSICGAKDHWHNFCPNCGADMRKEASDV